MGGREPLTGSVEPGHLNGLDLVVEELLHREPRRDGAEEAAEVAEPGCRIPAEASGCWLNHR